MRTVFVIIGLCCSLAFANLASAQPKTLTIALGAEPDSGFDPIYGWGKYNNPLFQSSLIKRGSKLNLTPDLALSWTLSKDKLSWNIKVREDVLFSDGSRLTAEDIKFTFDTAKAAVTVHDLTNLSNVIITSKSSLLFELKHPDINFIDNFINLAIVPAHSYNSHYGQMPIGTGPFELVRWDKGQQLIVKVNPYYYEQKPFFEKLIIVFSDEDSRYSRLVAGQLDLAAIAPRYAQALPADFKLWSLESVDNRGISWPMVDVQNTDIGNGVTSQFAIRQAIDRVINRDVLVHQLLDGHATAAYSIADGLPWGPVELPTPMSPDKQLSGAIEILEQSGWQLIDGIRQKQGLKASMTLYYLAGDSIREQLALTVAQMVKPLGIEIHPRGESWENIYKHMHNQPVLFGFGSHSSSEVRFVHHSQYRGMDYYNAGYYANAELDAVLDSAQHAASWQESLPYWRHAQALIRQDLPWTWLVNLRHLYAANRCLDLAEPGVEPHGHGWPLANNISQWRWTCQ
ncbi:ABC transporter substrate-binding protein [Shewanella canadensis]|uniref:ABC transporter substrate-binding protein n=1 Tax=Shewanella canadensis TaxID=271096 RepID=A0A3S0KU37_9GAMM|nr:ABC transporter substrate-binding protein [Shewanella canadensis]RTR37827.1 ABC transporter substrate-binding protein [Shewanella canadensis]